MKPSWNTITAQFSLHYTTLGAFTRPPVPARHAPLALRVEYAGKGRHHASRTRRRAAWALSRIRDAADWAFGAFTTPEEAR